MSQKSKSSSRQPTLQIDSEVVRQIRQHARSTIKTEICGVLIGQDRDGVVKVEASITGVNAEEAGAHVTFTQDTWQHIYEVKDKEFPNERIVGWYHSHPGFGVFLSEHDTFIHKNFFSSPGQVAWVFDPHSDEEGCFGWVSGRIERITEIAVVDRRGGERADENHKPEPSYSEAKDKDQVEGEDTGIHIERRPASLSDETSNYSSLERLVAMFFSYLTALLVGFLLSWYLFPRVVIMPVPVDPLTGRPLQGSMEDSRPNSTPDNGGGAANRPAQPQNNGSAKGDNAQPK